MHTRTRAITTRQVSAVTVHPSPTRRAPVSQVTAVKIQKQKNRLHISLSFQSLQTLSFQSLKVLVFTVLGPSFLYPYYIPPRQCSSRALNATWQRSKTNIGNSRDEKKSYNCGAYYRYCLSKGSKLRRLRLRYNSKGLEVTEIEVELQAQKARSVEIKVKAYIQQAQSTEIEVKTQRFNRLKVRRSRLTYRFLSR